MAQCVKDTSFYTVFFGWWNTELWNRRNMLSLANMLPMRDFEMDREIFWLSTA